MVADCQISLLPCSVFNITLMVWVSHTLYALFTLMDTNTRMETLKEVMNLQHFTPSSEALFSFEYTNTKQMVQVLEPALATLLNHPYSLPHDY